MKFSLPFPGRPGMNLLGLLALTGVLAGFFLASSEPAQDSPTSWSYTVIADELTNVDSLVVTSGGDFYATLQQQDGGGALVRLEPKADDPAFLGLAAVIADGLVRPDGRKTRMISGLDRPESVAVDADGTVFVAEAGTGRVLRVSAKGVVATVEDLHKPGRVEVAPDGALWITENVGGGRVLRYHQGWLETIRSGLDHPHGITFDPDGNAFIAERGRERILKLHRPAVSGA